jgi:predicted ATPase
VLAREQGLPVWVPSATTVEEGIAQIQQSLVAQQAAGMRIAGPSFLILLSEAHAVAGQAETGLGVLAEALAQIDHTGEQYHEAEVYRLKGELLLQ